MNFLIRPIDEPLLNQLIVWAGLEGWNPGLNDGPLFWNVDPEGFLGIELDGVFAGGGAVIRHSASFGFMGLFLVDPAYRGRGLGRILWGARRDSLLRRLSPGATIGLDGVDAMVSFYQQGGFRRSTRHRRFRSPAGMAFSETGETVCTSQIPLEQLLEMDQLCFPGGPRRTLAAWISQPGAISKAVVRNGHLEAYGILRPCLTGWKIGPLFAEHIQAAESVLMSLLTNSDNRPVFIDAPDNNPAAIRLYRSLGMDEIFGCERMYLGPQPAIDPRRIFGVTTLEIG